MKRWIPAALGFVLIPVAVLAQSSVLPWVDFPNTGPGNPLTAAQLTQALQAKQDYNAVGQFTALNASGAITFSGFGAGGPFCVHETNGVLTPAGADCGSGGGGSSAFSAITAGTNTTAAMVVGSGASITVTGSGINTATSVPFAGMTSGTNTAAAMVVGAGSSLNYASTGVINATTFAGKTLGTVTDGDVCTYTAAGTTINCNTSISGGGNVSTSGSITTNGFTYWNGSTTVASTAAATNGQLLIGSTSAAPVAATLTAGSPNISITNAAGSITIASIGLINAQTGNYSILTGDNTKLITQTDASTSTLTLPQAGTSGFGTGWGTSISNIGTGAATLSTTTSIIMGSGTTLLIPPGAGASVVSDGTNYPGIIGVPPYPNNSADCLLGNGTWGSCSAGASGVTFTDGTHTVSSATHLTVTGGTIGGTSPNATLTVSGGGGTNAHLAAQTPSDPTGNASTSTAVMMGMGATCHITPTNSGAVTFMFTGVISNSAINGGAQVGLRYGTGSAPANAATLTGTAVGNITGVSQNLLTTGGDYVPYALTAVVTGLTPSTAYWFDASLIATGSGTASIIANTCSASES